MRSIAFVTVVPLALVAAIAACESQQNASSFGAGEDNAPSSPVDGGGLTFSPSDGGVTDMGTSHGSPLCGSLMGACSPDEGIDGCTEASEGDEPDASLATPTTGCRLVESDDDAVATCGVADRRGVEGVACTKGADCAPGFDCVDGANGPVCRRYCCAGSCADQTSRSGGQTFCDIQKLVDFNARMAPVCMPLKACQLLHAGECGDKETCAVVDEKGATGCVPKGTAGAGEACDAVHCDADLTCLGSPGDRRCYKLCRVDGADCEPMQTCTTGSVFHDTTFGVCKED